MNNIQKKSILIGDILSKDISSDDFSEEQEQKLSTSGKEMLELVNIGNKHLLGMSDILTEISSTSKKVSKILETKNIGNCKNHILELLKLNFNNSEDMNEIMEDYLKYREYILGLIKVIITRQEYDYLTKLKNRHSLVETGNEFIKEGKNLNVIIIDLNDFKIKNDTFGHDYGDIMLRLFSIYISYFFNGNENVVFRTGGDEFIIYSTLDDIDSSMESFKLFLNNGIIIDGIDNGYYKDLDNMINNYNNQKGRDIDISDILKNFSFSYGYSNIIDLNQCDNFNNETENKSHKVDNTHGLRNLITIADKRMYEAKSKSKNKNLRKGGLNLFIEKLTSLFHFNKKQIT